MNSCVPGPRRSSAAALIPSRTPGSPRPPPHPLQGEASQEPSAHQPSPTPPGHSPWSESERSEDRPEESRLSARSLSLPPAPGSPWSCSSCCCRLCCLLRSFSLSCWACCSCSSSFCRARRGRDWVSCQDLAFLWPLRAPQSRMPLGPGHKICQQELGGGLLPGKTDRRVWPHLGSCPWLPVVTGPAASRLRFFSSQKARFSTPGVL